MELATGTALGNTVSSDIFGIFGIFSIFRYLRIPFLECVNVRSRIPITHSYYIHKASQCMSSTVAGEPLTRAGAFLMAATWASVAGSKCVS